MAGTGQGWMLPFVEPRLINLTLELELADDALTGRVTAPDGTGTEFSGWLGLVATIETVLNAPATTEPGA